MLAVQHSVAGSESAAEIGLWNLDCLHSQCHAVDIAAEVENNSAELAGSTVAVELGFVPATEVVDSSAPDLAEHHTPAVHTAGCADSDLHIVHHTG